MIRRGVTYSISARSNVHGAGNKQISYHENEYPCQGKNWAVTGVKGLTRWIMGIRYVDFIVSTVSTNCLSPGHRSEKKHQATVLKAIAVRNYDKKEKKGQDSNRPGIVQGMLPLRVRLS